MILQQIPTTNLNGGYKYATKEEMLQVNKERASARTKQKSKENREYYNEKQRQYRQRKKEEKFRQQLEEEAHKVQPFVLEAYEWGESNYTQQQLKHLNSALPALASAGKDYINQLIKNQVNLCRQLQVQTEIINKIVAVHDPHFPQYNPDINTTITPGFIQTNEEFNDMRNSKLIVTPNFTMEILN